MNEKQIMKLFNAKKMLIAMLCLIGVLILLFSILYSAPGIASADNSLINSSEMRLAEAKALDYLKTNYNFNDQEALALVEKAKLLAIANQELSPTSSDTSITESIIYILLVTLAYTEGRHNNSYDHVYIDECSLDDHFYVNNSLNSLKASNYNEQNIMCQGSFNKNILPRNRNAIDIDEPTNNTWLINDFDTFLMFPNPGKITLRANETNILTDDSWSSGVYYRGTTNIIPNSNKRIGKGAVFYRYHYYDVKGEKITNTSNWTAYTNIFANSNTFDLCTISASCDIEIVVVYETYVNSGYHNLREDFYIKARKDATPFYMQIMESNQTQETSILGTSVYTTPDGFRIQPKPFTKYEVSMNGGATSVLTFDQCLTTSFSIPGEYSIQYIDVIGYGKLPPVPFKPVIIVDCPTPTLKLNSINLADHDFYIDDVACFKNGSYKISWEENENIPTTVKLDETVIANNSIVSTGEHTITITKEYTSKTQSKTYKINIGSFPPNHNYNLLKNGNSYTNRANRFSTKYYGVRLLENGVTNLYGYDTQKEALDKALEYERVNYVTQNSNNSFTYRGTTYSDNASLTAAMNVYAQMYLFENRDLSLTENVFLESALKQDKLYLNGFLFTYNSNPVFSSSVRIYKAPNISDALTANVKSILRDASNPNVKNVEYNKVMDEQLSKSGKYFIMEKNAFGEEYFFEAYFAAANETTAAIEYYDASGIRKTTNLSKSNTALITGTAINIKTIGNTIDPFATIKIRNIVTNASRILVVGDSYTITEAGSYSLTFIDRNNKQFSVLVSVTNPAYILSGVSNGGTANNDVTVSLKSGYAIQSFIVDGVSKGNVLQYDPTTGRYEYTIAQTTAQQEVVLIFTYGGQTVNLAFTISNT